MTGLEFYEWAKNQPKGELEDIVINRYWTIDDVNLEIENFLTDEKRTVDNRRLFDEMLSKEKMKILTDALAHKGYESENTIRSEILCGVEKWLQQKEKEKRKEHIRILLESTATELIKEGEIKCDWFDIMDDDHINDFIEEFISNEEDTKEEYIDEHLENWVLTYYREHSMTIDAIKENSYYDTSATLFAPMFFSVDDVDTAWRNFRNYEFPVSGELTKEEKIHILARAISSGRPNVKMAMMAAIEDEVRKYWQQKQEAKQGGKA